MIENTDRLGQTPPRATALACLEAAIEAGDPRRIVENSVSFENGRLTVGSASIPLDPTDELVVVGGGKAAGAVAQGLEAVLGDRIDRGIIVTNEAVSTDSIEVRLGSHPIPSAPGVEATRDLLTLVDSGDEKTVLLVIVTGGGSALLTAPVSDVDLESVQSVTQDLLDRGATIDDVNAVRKHVSAIKGGALARRAHPSRTIGLLFSDVVGDDPAVIASGPTAPDPTTFEDAIAVLDRYDISVPPDVETYLQSGMDGTVPETPTESAAVFDRVTNVLLATVETVLEAARSRAIDRGYTATILASRLTGEAREAGRFHAAVANEIVHRGEPISPPAVVLSGGETTVTVKGDGTGGPNQEVTLAAGIDLEGGESTVVASIDTDGIDGPTPAAGGLVDGTTIVDPSEAMRSLEENDAYSYLDAHEATIETGPTGTNLNDCRIIVVERDTTR